MNQAVRPQPTPIRIAPSACPHDCPSTCALEIEVLDAHTIGRVHGAEDNDYTAGVICAKVARYAERVHHPDRLTRPLIRQRREGLGLVRADRLGRRARSGRREIPRRRARYGAEAVWPYYYAGTMGLVMRDGIHRLRHAKKYSGFHTTICINGAYVGFAAGTGKIAGSDPREMAKSDLVVIWGTNPVNTQVNVMTHATRARKERGAKIVAVDVYMNGTMEQADLAVLVKPGTDAALACAVMHCLFRDGKADWDYLNKYTDAPRELEAHLRNKTPQWAEAITGCPAATIEEFARLVGATKRAFFRLGYGFARSRNGPVSMHAALCIPAITGAWLHEGGGAFHNNADIYHWNKSMLEGHDVRDKSVRMLDQSRIGAILTGDKASLCDGPPVTAMLIQNTNPVSVCPDQDVVKRGFARDDLFVCVHEQFMTETARMADVVLPATMFMEHDDVYQGGGHQHIILGAEGDRAARRMPLQPRGDLRAGEARRRRASGLRHDGAPDDRLNAAEVRLGHARRARSQEVDRLPAGLRDRALHQGLQLAGRQIPLQAGLAERAVPQPRPGGTGRADAEAAGLLDHHRGGGRAASVPARHLAVARLPQLDVQRDAELAGEGRAADRDDPSGRCGAARHRRRLGCHRRQHAGQGASARQGVRRRAPRRADRGIDLAERRLSRRARHQHHHRRGPDRAVWRRGVPRQQGLDQAGCSGLTLPQRRASASELSSELAVERIGSAAADQDRQDDAGPRTRDIPSRRSAGSSGKPAKPPPQCATNTITRNCTKIIAANNAGVQAEHDADRTDRLQKPHAVGQRNGRLDAAACQAVGGPNR